MIKDSNQDLHVRIDQYMDALITYDEMVESIPRIRYYTAELTAHPKLTEAFTAIGIAALLARVAIIRAEIGEKQAPVVWTITADGTRMTGNILLRGDQISDEMIPANNTDFSWIFPSISYDLPENSIIGDSLPTELRKLSVMNSILVTQWHADAIMDMKNEGYVHF